MRRMRTLREDDAYADACTRLGDPARLDEALQFLLSLISQEPELFPTLGGDDQYIHIAKTQTPPLRIFFTIDDDDMVTLRWIERIPEIIEEEDIF